MANLEIANVCTPKEKLQRVREAARGNKHALILLLTQSRVRLCARITRRIPAHMQSAIAADDIVQEAHVEVFRRIRGFEPASEESFDRWMTTIALRRLRSNIRNIRAVKRGGDRWAVPTNRSIDDSSMALFDCLAASSKTPSRIVSRQDAVQAMQGAMKLLPDDYRQALWLVHIEGRSVKEAGQQMGRSERAIHGLCRRGLEQLQSNLGNRSDFLTSG